ncbi:hypothetical protein DPPLL_26250 [Desulfofustis limnaeus]|jgi:hypothetical protein|uniref:Uncharacterized protein n=1 Tax=Desulfofustis limnaeus TaxID=2740163 RepID=A0ABM7WB97_9BACT|nr:hypothetical protein DPPLL_26250 [Desulfofustis limnaeus]
MLLKTETTAAGFGSVDRRKGFPQVTPGSLSVANHRLVAGCGTWSSLSKKLQAKKSQMETSGNNTVNVLPEPGVLLTLILP